MRTPASHSQVLPPVALGLALDCRSFSSCTPLRKWLVEQHPLLAARAQPVPRICEMLLSRKVAWRKTRVVLTWAEFCTRCREEVPALAKAADGLLRAAASYLHDAGDLIALDHGAAASYVVLHPTWLCSLVVGELTAPEWLRRDARSAPRGCLLSPRDIELRVAPPPPSPSRLTSPSASAKLGAQHGAASADAADASGRRVERPSGHVTADLLSEMGLCFRCDEAALTASGKARRRPRGDSAPTGRRTPPMAMPTIIDEDDISWASSFTSLPLPSDELEARNEAGASAAGAPSAGAPDATCAAAPAAARAPHDAAPTAPNSALAADAEAEESLFFFPALLEPPGRRAADARPAVASALRAALLPDEPADHGSSAQSASELRASAHEPAAEAFKSDHDRAEAIASADEPAAEAAAEAAAKEEGAEPVAEPEAEAATLALPPAPPPASPAATGPRAADASTSSAADAGSTGAGGVTGGVGAADVALGRRLVGRTADDVLVPGFIARLQVRAYEDGTFEAAADFAERLWADGMLLRQAGAHGGGQVLIERCEDARPDGSRRAAIDVIVAAPEAEDAASRLLSAARALVRAVLDECCPGSVLDEYALTAAGLEKLPTPAHVSAKLFSARSGRLFSGKQSSGLLLESPSGKHGSGA